MSDTRELSTPTDRVAWAIDQVKLNGTGLESLAESIGCTHSTLSQWQTGHTRIENAKAGLLEAFCKATGVSMHWLLHGGTVCVNGYTSSERVAALVQKLAAMETSDMVAFNMASKMIDAVAPATPPTPLRRPN